MSDDLGFLSHLFSEDIYTIDEELQVKSTVPIESNEDQTQHDKPKEALELKPIMTHGENLKHCLVLFQAKEKLRTESKALLFKILEAIDRKPKDVLMANLYDCSPEGIEAFLVENKHQHLISFDVTAVEPLSKSTVYLPIQDHGKTYLLADSLEAISLDIEKKKALWKALKSIFK
jgi:hypothetical protein